jgi:hypothetical protein
VYPLLTQLVYEVSEAEATTQLKCEELAIGGNMALKE